MNTVNMVSEGYGAVVIRFELFSEPVEKIAREMEEREAITEVRRALNRLAYEAEG